MKVALVTGSNKGIGFAIVRLLCKQFDGDVYLTARNTDKGRAAVVELEKEGLSPKFHQLDILDNSSIKSLKDFLFEKYGGIDVLVNNAGIAYPKSDPTPFATQVSVTLETNYTALLNVCDAMFPILKPGARVVHLSSNAFIWFLKACSDENRKKIISACSVEGVTSFIEEFSASAQKGDHENKGFPESAYGASKCAVTAIVTSQQTKIDSERPGSDIIINSCSPGYVKTDMTGHNGYLTPEQGAETPVYLALLPPGTEIKGEYCFKKTTYDWRNGEYPDF